VSFRRLAWVRVGGVGLLALFLPMLLLAQFSPPPLDYAVYATGTGCGAINLSGNAYTDSFDSSQGSYKQTKKTTGGDVGASGNISLSGSATVNGTISALNINVGNCRNGTPGITASGKAQATGGYVQLSAPPSLPNPPAVTPGSKDYSFTKNASLAPGSYHNIAVTGGATLTFSAGTYNVNSIALSGNSILTFNGTGQVVVNVAGNQVSQPLNFSGGSISNPSGIALNFQLIYGGSQTNTLSGGAASYAVAYMPNAPVSLSGRADWYGAMVVNTLNDSGGSAVHFDRSLGAAVLLVVNPNGGQQGQQNLTVALTGQFTHWVQGTSTVSFGAGITVVSLTVNSPATATALVNVDPQAATGTRTVTVTTGSEIATLNNGFTVAPGTPVLVAVNPNSGQQGQQNLSVALAGQYTHWAQGTTTADFGSGITVSSLKVNSPTSATAVLNVDPAAATNTRTVTATTGGEIASLDNGFTVTAGTPVLVTVNPSSGQQGQQNESAALTGQYTHWAQGTTSADFGAGITVVSLTVNSATSATAVINIDPGAATGSRTVTVTTGNEVVPLANAFTVISENGVLVGTVLSNLTGLPFSGATLQVLGHSDQADVSDQAGRYSIQVSEQHLFLQISQVSNNLPVVVPVEREVWVQTGTGTVPINARLTPLSPPMVIDVGGGTLSASLYPFNISISIPQGAVLGPTSFHLTPLSAQGLPNLLPLGWSPIVTFDWSSDSVTGANSGATLTGLPQIALQLVSYDTNAHAWTMVAANLTPASDGTLSAALPSTGIYALAVPDVGSPINIPAPGQRLTGVGMVALASDAIGTGTLEPSALGPGGGTAQALLTIQSSSSAPSGTVIQSSLTENYSLTSGDKVVEESRLQDIVLYQYGAPSGSILAAQLPITPSHTFQPTQLIAGEVDLDILSGRENVRGQVGGNDAFVVQSGSTVLTVAAGSLPQDTAVSVSSEALDSFLPSSNSATPISEVGIDFSGEVLTSSAQLSVDGTGVQSTDNIVIAQVDFISGIPRLEVVALAQLVGNNLISQPYAGLRGITQEGEYVFYRVASQLGFIAGTASTNGNPTQAIVYTNTLPFIGLADNLGRYIIAALPGTVNVIAAVPNTSLTGSGSAQVTAGQTSSFNIALNGVVTLATISPSDGSVAVPITTEIDVTTTAPVNPGTVNINTIQLYQGPVSNNVLVPVQFVITQGGTRIAVLPQQSLLAGQQYTIKISGLADAYGGLVSAPNAAFTTASSIPPSFDTSQIMFSYPDANGVVQVSAPPGLLPAGTTVEIVDLGSGQVTSLTAANDGSLSGQIRATISDVLQVTVTDPLQNTTTFQRGQFVAADGSVGIGSAGGTVQGTGGVQLQIPAGALTRGITLKIQSFDANAFPERPDLPNSNFGGGLQVTSSDMPTFQKEVKLVFPKPNAPDGAFYYVYRRLLAPNGQIAFETIDHAFVQGQGSNATVVTATYPFPGYYNSYSSLNGTGGVFTGLGNGTVLNFFLMWTFDVQAPNFSTLGVVTGKVEQAYVQGTPRPDRPDLCPVTNGITQYCPLEGVPVSFADAQGNPIPSQGVSVTQSDGTYSMFNPNYLSGNAVVTAFYNGVNQTATAFNFSTADGIQFPWLAPLFAFYPQISSANITFPATQGAPPAPRAQILLFTSDANGNRQAVSGISTVGTPLIVGFKSTTDTPLDVKTTQASIQGPTGQGGPLTLQTDQSNGPNQVDLVGYFIPPQAGSYTVTLAITPAGGNPAQFSSNFLVVANAGQGNTQVLPGQPPAVISIVPADGASDVPTDVFPQVVFNQPVIDVVTSPSTANVSLADASGSAVPFGISATGVDAQGNTYLIPDLKTKPPNTPVVSITLIPQGSLKFSTTYSIDFTAGIFNNDQNNLLPMSPVSYSFTTLAPENVNDTNAFPAVGLLVLGSRVYLPERDARDGTLRAFDISNPDLPREFADGPIHGAAIDIVGEQNSPVVTNSENIQVPPADPIPGNLIVVGASHLVPDGPSNLWLYQDIDQETGDLNPSGLQPIGAMSLTGSLEEGTVIRVAVKGQFAYTITRPYGLQVVDLYQVTQEWTNAINGRNNWNVDKMNEALTLPGAGFARDTVVSTVPMGANPDGSGQFQEMSGLVVGDFFLPDKTNPTLAVATGRIPLFVANPATQQVLFRDATQLTTAQGSLTSGWALALGSIGDTCPSGNARPFAVVAGSGTAPDPNNPGNLSAPGSPVVAVIDLCNPAMPNPLSFFLLSAQATDVKVRGTLAYVATRNQVVIIDFSSPSAPRQVGMIDESAEYGGSLAPVFGHIALAGSGLILSTSLDSTYGGLHINSVGPAEDNADPEIGDCSTCETGSCEGCEKGVGTPVGRNFNGGTTVTNGNTWIQQSDYTLPGLGDGLELTRTWNSRWRDVGPPQVVGMFGDGWHSNVEERIIFVFGKKATLWRGDGSAWTFNYDTSNNIFVLADPVTARAKYVYDANTGRSTITFKDGTQELFDHNGYLLSQTDRNGNSRTFVYDSNSHLTSVTDAAGRSITFTYAGPSSPNVTSVVDSAGSVASYSYDAHNRLTRVNYSDNSAFTFNYDFTSMLTSVLDANSKVVQSYTYDSNHRGLTSQAASGMHSVTVAYPSAGAAQVTDSFGNVTNYGYTNIGKMGFLQSTKGPGCGSCGAVPGSAGYSYDAQGNLASSQDALGRFVSRTYDAKGNVASRTAKLNGQAVTYSYSYNSFSELVTATDPLGNTTSNTYDAQGNLLSTTTSAGTTSFAYDAKGQVIRITDPKGNRTVMAYTAAGLLASTTDALNNVTQYFYDGRGNRVRQVDALSNTTNYTYDPRNRLVKITFADNSMTTYAYDARGRRTSVTDGNGKTTAYQYDDADHLIAVTDAANNTTRYSYDSEGSLLSVADALSRTTSYGYDSQRRLTQTRYPSGLSESYSYDAVGNRTSKTDRKQQTIQYAYDALNRLSSKTYPDGTSVTYAYDLASRMTQARDSSGTYGFSYDGAGRLTGTGTQYGFLPNRNFTTSYGYDAASNRTSFTDAEGGSNSYSYDALNRLATLKDFTGQQFGFAYDALGREVSRSRPNGLTTTYSYDALSRLLSALHQVNGTTLDGAAYTYDPASNRKSKTNYLDNSVSSYTYDPTYQLTQATQASKTVESYSYDAVGNRLSSLNVASYSYDGSNHLTSSSDGTTYSYDSNGNTTAKADAGGATTFNWDFENRLAKVVLPGSSTVSFTYDPFGRRIQKLSAGGTVNYLYDGASIVEEVDQNGTSLGRYTQRGQSIDQPLFMVRSSITSYYEADGLGSISSLSDPAGALANTYTYDAFGNKLSSMGALANSFQFTGREFDSETSLNSYRARYYSSSIGRFIGEDPLRDDTNLYRYVLNRPSTLTDPTGLQANSDRYDVFVSDRAPNGNYRSTVSAKPCSCEEEWIRKNLGGLGDFAADVGVPWFSIGNFRGITEFGVGKVSAYYFLPTAGKAFVKDLGPIALPPLIFFTGVELAAKAHCAQKQPFQPWADPNAFMFGYGNPQSIYQ